MAKYKQRSRSFQNSKFKPLELHEVIEEVKKKVKLSPSKTYKLLGVDGGVVAYSFVKKSVEKRSRPRVCSKSQKDG